MASQNPVTTFDVSFVMWGQVFTVRWDEGRLVSDPSDEGYTIATEWLAAYDGVPVCLPEFGEIREDHVRNLGAFEQVLRVYADYVAIVPVLG
jgi:hypothetical protein